MTALLAMTVCC